MVPQPERLRQVDGTARGVLTEIQAHHASREARRRAHKPQPAPEDWPGCLRGHTIGVLSHEGILALQRGEDVKAVRTNNHPGTFNYIPLLRGSS